MDLNLFATQVTTKGPALSNSNSALLGNNALGGIDSAAFWNTILGSLADGVTETTELKRDASNTNKEAALEPDKIQKETADLALLQLALLGQDPDTNLDEKLKELRIERIANNPENRVEQLTKLIDHLTSGLPTAAAEGNTSIGDLISRLTQRLEKLESSLEAFRTGDFGDDGAPFQALIATGLNPSQLTNITNRIEEVETKLGRELTIEDLIAGVGNIIPVPGDEKQEFEATDALEILLKTKDGTDEITDSKTSDSENSNTEINLPEEQKHIAGETPSTKTQQEQQQAYVDFMMPTFIDPASNIARVSEKASDNAKSRLIDVAEKVSTMTNANKVAPAGLALGALQPAISDTPEVPTPLTPAPTLASEFTEKPAGRINNAEFNAMFNKGNNFTNNNGAENGLSNKAMAAVKNVASLPTLPKTGDIALSTNWADALPASNILSELAGFDIQSGTPFNNVMQAVAHVTSANSQAGQTHPATSMVAAHISKAAQNSDNRNITLQLDPPELGRVEIRLEFGSEKSVQAHLVVEKPETLLMLQRDMNALEKALQDAGLDTDSGSLNYEMASEDYNFNSNREGNNQNGGTGDSGENAENAENDMIIETTMTWDVDPETGHVHYSLLA